MMVSPMTKSILEVGSRQRKMRGGGKRKMRNGLSMRLRK